MVLRRYRHVRMPEDVFQLYVRKKNKMEKDVLDMTGKKINLTMPKVFRAVASPKMNENRVVVDIRKLMDLAKKRKNYEYLE